jgi:2-polyprenyl-3-methyl-5-hydroxy-6-metoxy-1,4-benzoquinol methylase
MEKYLKKCVLCGSENIKAIRGYEFAWLCKCKNCSMVFSSRNPSAGELEEYYKGYGRNDYLSPLTIKRYHEILDIFEPYRKTNKLIDVGCGIGYFLDVAKTRGWEVYGTEFTDKAIEICESKGIIMKKGVLNPGDFTEGEFDIITSFEVIEHINTPNEEIESFRKILRAGGAVYITTPNFNSLLRYYLKGSYNVIGWPEHLSYYTPLTLKKVMQKHGFQPQFVKATGISITRFRTSRGPSTSEEIREGTEFISADTADEKLRNSMERNKILGSAKRTVNTMLTLSGKGDALKALFVKT